MKILVTGANGQLAQEIIDIAEDYIDFEFIFFNKEELDIVNEESVLNLFSSEEPDVVINVAAYTKVDLAESEKVLAHQVNIIGAANIAKAAKKIDAELYHISTDFVFDGESNKPYIETDKTNPLSVYGTTKLEGEKKVLENCEKAIIIRTSWLYSCYATNFVKTILKLSKEKSQISVVNDQIGSPTSAASLVMAIITMIWDDEKTYGEIYHFSNGGQCSWFEFAKEIVRLKNIKCKIKAIKTSDYPTKAERPKYSVMNSSKISKTFGIEIIDWKEELGYEFEEKKY